MATGTTETAAVTFDFATIQPKVIERLQTRKIPVVDPFIVKLAQQAYDGYPDPRYPDQPDKLVHSASFTFAKGDEDRMKAFIKGMKNAGLSTTPPTSVSVVVDEKDDHLVKWRVSKRKGRNVEAEANGQSQS